MNIQIDMEAQAEARLRSLEFRQQWLQLVDRCPWATAFQGPEFVETWYDSYQSQYSPLLVSGLDTTARLIGLLPLARERDTGRVIVAGGRQAEYQTWLAVDSAQETFIERGLEELAARVQMELLSFKYIPSAQPLSWIARTSNRWAREETRHSRAFIRTDNPASVADYLQKKKTGSTKNYLNRLKRLGNVRFDRIRNTADLAAIVDDLIAYYDFRQGAINDVVPFQADPLKKPFYLALFRHPNLLHVSVLRVDNELISAMVGIADGRTYSLAMPIFSPFRAQYSPVTIHLLMLVDLLSQEGFTTLDLTPGEDAFKERFATDHDIVTTLTVYFRRSLWLRKQASHQAGRLAAKGLHRLRLSPPTVRAFISGVQRRGPAEVFAAIGRKIKKVAASAWSTTELNFYWLPAGEAAALKGDARLQRDHLANLFAFRPRFGWQSRQRFLRDCLNRIENGDHFYTYVEDGLLIHYIWLADRQEKNFFSETEEEFHFPPGTAVLYDSYTDPTARGRGIYQAGLRQAARDAGLREGTQHVYGTALASNRPSTYVLTKVGFHYIGSLFLKKKFGRKIRRSTVPLLPGTPTASPE